MMQYVLHVTIDEAELDGDDSVEAAARFVTSALNKHDQGTVASEARPLSEIIAC